MTTPQFRGSDNQALPDSGNWVHLDTVTTGGKSVRSADWAGFQLSGVADAAQRDLLGTDLANDNRVADGGVSIDTILDNGAFGLAWFKAAIDRYNQAFHYDPSPLSGGDVTGLVKLERAYDLQRGMNLQPLLDTAAGLGSAVSTLQSDTLAQQQNAVRSLADAWGDSAGGAAAQSQLQALVQAATADLDIMSQKSKLIEDTVAAIRQVVVRKADAFSKLKDVNGIAGVSLDDDVSVVIGAAQGNIAGKDDQIAQIFNLEGARNSHDAWRNNAEQHCKDWVNNVFKPTVEGYVTAYYGLCVDTDATVAKLYGTLLAGLDEVDDHPYPSPQVVSPNNAPQSNAPSASAVGSGASPNSASPAPGTPAGPTSPSTVNSTTNNGDLGQISQVLQQGVSQFGQLAQQGISQIEQGAEQLFGHHDTSTGDNLSGGRHRMPDEDQHDSTDHAASSVPGHDNSSTDPHQLAAFELPGGHMKVVQTPDGNVTMEVAGPDGKSHPFTFEVQDGKPVITAGAPSPSDSTVAPIAAEPASTTASAAAPSTTAASADGPSVSASAADGDGLSVSASAADGDGLSVSASAADGDGLSVSASAADGDGLSVSASAADGDGFSVSASAADGEGASLSASPPAVDASYSVSVGAHQSKPEHSDEQDAHDDHPAVASVPSSWDLPVHDQPGLTHPAQPGATVQPAAALPTWDQHADSHSSAAHPSQPGATVQPASGSAWELSAHGQPAESHAFSQPGETRPPAAPVPDPHALGQSHAFSQPGDTAAPVPDLHAFGQGHVLSQPGTTVQPASGSAWELSSHGQPAGSHALSQPSLIGTPPAASVSDPHALGQSHGLSQPGETHPSQPGATVHQAARSMLDQHAFNGTIAASAGQPDMTVHSAAASGAPWDLSVHSPPDASHTVGQGVPGQPLAASVSEEYGHSQPGAIHPNQDGVAAQPVSAWVSAADHFDHGQPGPIHPGQPGSTAHPGAPVPDQHGFGQPDGAHPGAPVPDQHPYHQSSESHPVQPGTTIRPPAASVPDQHLHGGSAAALSVQSGPPVPPSSGPMPIPSRHLYGQPDGPLPSQPGTTAHSAAPVPDPHSHGQSGASYPEQPPTTAHSAVPGQPSQRQPSGSFASQPGATVQPGAPDEHSYRQPDGSFAGQSGAGVPGEHSYRQPGGSFAGQSGAGVLDEHSYRQSGGAFAGQPGAGVQPGVSDEHSHRPPSGSYPSQPGATVQPGVPDEHPYRQPGGSFAGQPGATVQPGAPGEHSYRQPGGAFASQPGAGLQPGVSDEHSHRPTGGGHPSQPGATAYPGAPGAEQHGFGQPGGGHPSQPGATVRPPGASAPQQVPHDHAGDIHHTKPIPTIHASAYWPSNTGQSDPAQTQPEYRPGPPQPDHGQRRTPTGVALQETDPM